MDNYQTLKRVLRVLQGYILYPDNLGRTNLKKICDILCIEAVEK